MSQVSTSRSLLRFRPLDATDTSVALHCFPFAGGGAHYYQHWAKNFQGFAIELPGRGQRLREAPATKFSDLLQDLARNLLPFLEPPYAFFGHSMGALLAFEFTRMLGTLSFPLPTHLFLSACRAPHLSARSRLWHALPDAELVTEVERLEGTPSGALQNEDIRSLMIPILRADFRLVEHYTYAATAPISVPISVYGGTDDPLATHGELSGWSEHTTDFRGVRLYPGGHFYLNDHGCDLVDVIRSELASFEEALGIVD